MLPSIIDMFTSAVAASKQAGTVTVISSQVLGEHQKGTIKSFVSSKFGNDMLANFSVSLAFTSESIAR